MVRKTLTFTLAALALGVAATAIVAGQRNAAAEEDFPPLGDFVEVTGGRIHYVQEGTGPHVVLLHGAGGNVREFTFDLMGRLTDSYTVTVFDRPGLGYSDRVPGVPEGPFQTEGDSPTAQARMLREAAGALGITDPIVVGHSFGGIVALAWALLGLDTEADANASGIVSLAGVAMPWPGELGWNYRWNGTAFGGAVLIPTISAYVPQSVVDTAIAETFAPQNPPEGYADYIGAPLTIRTDPYRANVRQVNTLRPHVVEMARRYPELTLPIEILHGTADTTVPIHVHAEEIIKIAPTARLTRMEGVGHMPHHADPDAAVAAIDRAADRAGLR